MATTRGTTVEPETPDRGATNRDVTKFALQGLERFGLLILLAAMFAFFAIDPKSSGVFTSSANLDSILGNQAVTGLVALAMVIPLVSGYFDLSVSATAGVANVAMAATIGPHGWPIWLGIAFALALGALIGLANGFLVAKLKLNGFVVTLGSYTLLGGLLQLYTQGRQITEGIPISFGEWGAGDWFGVPRPFWLLLMAGLIVWYLLTQTPVGRYLESIGSNEQAARLVGVDTTRVVWLGFVAAGVIAACAGILQTSRSGNGSAEVGSAFLFPSFVAVFLGATTIRPGRYNVWGTVIGVYFVALSVSGFTLLGAETWVQPVFNGGSLIAAVALSTLFARQGQLRAAASAAAPTNEDPPGSPAATEDRVGNV